MNLFRNNKNIRTFCFMIFNEELFEMIGVRCEFAQIAETQSNNCELLVFLFFSINFDFTLIFIDS